MIFRKFIFLRYLFMQDALIVKGKKELSGNVKISGSKNATLPILGASLFLKGKITLNNVPKISDVETILDILGGIGIKHSWKGSSLILDNSNISKEKADFLGMKKIRGSICLIPGLLHIFKNIKIPFPGGCVIGKRSINSHLDSLVEIGYKYKFLEDDTRINIYGKALKGEKVLNAGFSVTTTENLLIENVLRDGKTIIKSTAIEPHVMNLVSFLRKAGADIKIRYDHQIIVNGVKKLAENLEFEIVSDYIEAGTFMIIGALASKEFIDIENARIDDLYVFIEKLKEAGVRVKNLGKDRLRVFRAKRLKGINIQTNIFPGFPTDLQSPFAVLMTQAKGISKINEVMFEGRLNAFIELEKMGVNLAILNSHDALIFGPNVLKGKAALDSWDLRAGAAMIIAALIKDGETKITNVNYIYRGYENFVEKLKKLGAEVGEEKC